MRSKNKKSIYIGRVFYFIITHVCITSSSPPPAQAFNCDILASVEPDGKYNYVQIKYNVVRVNRYYYYFFFIKYVLRITIYLKMFVECYFILRGGRGQRVLRIGVVPIAYRENIRAFLDGEF